MPDFHSPYLSEEAERERIDALVRRISRLGQCSADYLRLPHSVQKRVDCEIAIQRALVDDALPQQRARRISK